MARHLSLLIVLIIISVHHRSCPEAAVWFGQSNQSRITNGDDVPEGQWPFIAALIYEQSDTNFCGGSVLNDDTILTAAHCMFGQDGQLGDPSKMTVYLGHVDWIAGWKDENYLFQAEQIYVHEQYNPGYIQAGHDVAVIKLDRKIDFSALENVAPTCLPEGDTPPQTENCIVMGWGWTTETGDLPSRLQQVDLAMLKQEECGWYWPDYDQETILCANADDGQKNSCYGDSGGPLVCLTEGEDEPVYLQYGIVSFGSEYCGYDPVYYTRVRALLDWIIEKAEQ